MTRVVAIYSRVSNEEQLSAGENQVQYYDEILKKHPDWKLYDKYIDEKNMWSSINKRKEFMEKSRNNKKEYDALVLKINRTFNLNE